MQDFLTFKTFVTPSLLIIFYYIGAIVIPFLSWYLTHWMTNKYFLTLSQTMIQTIKSYTTIKQRLITYFVLFLCVFCMELMWRIMFEFVIAYFNIHDALIQTTEI